MHHLESLFDRALDAVIGMDDAGNVIAWNRAAEDIFGWTRAEALGASIGNLIVPPQHRSAHATGLQTYKRTGQGPVLEQKLKITALARDRSEFPVELSIFPMAANDGSRMFYAFIRSLAAEVSFARDQALRAAEADALFRIGQHLIDETSLDDFTRFCLEEVCALSGLVAGHLFVVGGMGGGQVLRPSSAWHIRDDSFHPVIDATAQVTFAPGEGLPGRAWAQGRMQALDNLNTAAGFVRRDVFLQVGLTKAVAVPVRHGGRIHGILEFFGTTDSRLDPQILRILESVGNHIGVAIRRKEAAEYRETLRRELSHRVGNSLAVLASIYRSCARRATSIDALTESFLGRLTSMGQANLVAIEGARRPVDLAELVRNAVAILPDPGQVTLDLADLRISRDWVMPLSLVLHELATNALKHGTVATASRLAIHARILGEPAILELTWVETHDAPAPANTAPANTAPANTAPANTAPGNPGGAMGTGYGTRLIAAMIESKLGGSFERSLAPDGFRFRARLPAGEPDEPTDGAFSVRARAV